MASINATHISDAVCIVYCIDLTRLQPNPLNPGYLELVKKELAWIHTQNSVVIPLILVGTKSDLLSDAQLHEISSRLTGKFKAPVLITSSKTNTGIEDLLVSIKAHIAKIQYAHTKEDNFFKCAADTKSTGVIHDEGLPNHNVKK